MSDEPKLKLSTLVSKVSGGDSQNEPNTPNAKASVYTRCLLYVLISMVSALIAELTALKGVETVTTIDWVITWAKITLPGLITWRAFIDQSARKLELKLPTK